MSWASEAAKHLAEQHPAIWRLCYPHRILPPSGFTNPLEFSVAMWGHLQLWAANQMFSEPHAMVVSSSVALMHRHVPTYFIEPEFAAAVARTRLPTGLKFRDLMWPLDSMLVCLHSEFSKNHFGYRLPFIALNRILAGVYPASYHRPDLAHFFRGNKPMQCLGDRVIFNAHAFTESQNTPTEYSSCYPMREDISMVPDAPFCDATPMERERWGISAPAAMAPQDDKELANHIVSFCVKLLLILAAAPRTVKTGELARPEKVKHGAVVRDALWHPNMIGAGFRFSRDSASEAGSHASPRMHLRWGHFTHQTVGKRDDQFVSTSALPRTAEGQIDWAVIPEETRVQFWRNHELRWIEPQVVNAPDEANRS